MDGGWVSWGAGRIEVGYHAGLPEQTIGKQAVCAQAQGLRRKTFLWGMLGVGGTMPPLKGVWVTLG